MFGLFKKKKEDVARLDSLATFADVLHRRIVALEVENAYITEQLHKHEQAAGGGFWKTAEGHLLRIRDMSTEHIKNCLAGNFTNPDRPAHDNMKLELSRRMEEDYWRSKPMPVKAPVEDDTSAESAEGVLEVPGGNKIHVGDMSTDYIQSLLWGRVYPHALATLQKELQRRRSKPMPDKPKEADVAYVGRIDSTPIYVAHSVGMMQMKRVTAFIERAKEMRPL